MSKFDSDYNKLQEHPIFIGSIAKVSYNQYLNIQNKFGIKNNNKQKQKLKKRKTKKQTNKPLFKKRGLHQPTNPFLNDHPTTGDM